MPACNQNLAKSKTKSFPAWPEIAKAQAIFGKPRGWLTRRAAVYRRPYVEGKKKGRESWRGANCSKCCRFFGKTVTQCRRSLHDAARCVAWFFLKACGIPLHGRSSGQLLLASPCGSTVVARKVGNVNIPVLNF